MREKICEEAFFQYRFELFKLRVEKLKISNQIVKNKKEKITDVSLTLSLMSGLFFITRSYHIFVLEIN